MRDQDIDEELAAAEKPVISRPSLASLRLHIYFDETKLATATGFCVARDCRAFLVTNRHNVRGRDNNTDACLNEHAAIPNRVEIIHNVRGRPGSWIPKSESLLDDEDRRLWHEHPGLGGHIDVVALELTDLTDVEIHGHDPWDQSRLATLSPSSYLSIIGFPFGYAGGGALPIWVQGAIATEPSVDWDGLPRFLIDSRTRPGQSGPPVILYREAGLTTNAAGEQVVIPGPHERFVGVYSGRISEQSDLGIVWKPRVVQEIVEAALGQPRR